MCPEAAGVNDSLRNSFVIEVENLFAKMKVLESCWTATSYFQRILIVRYRYALLGSQLRDAILGDLMNLATGPSLVIFWSINRALCDDYQPFWSLTYSPDTLVAAKDEPPECPRFDAFLRAGKW